MIRIGGSAPFHPSIFARSCSNSCQGRNLLIAPPYLEWLPLLDLRRKRKGQCYANLAITALHAIYVKNLSGISDAIMEKRTLATLLLQHRPAPQLCVQQLAHQLRHRPRLWQLLGELVAAPFQASLHSHRVKFEQRQSRNFFICPRSCIDPKMATVR